MNRIKLKLARCPMQWIQRRIPWRSVCTTSNKASPPPPPLLSFPLSFAEEGYFDAVPCLSKSTCIVGKNVAYVGGYGGIGYACCKKLVHEGIRYLTILDVQENRIKRRCLNLINPNLKISFVPLNLCDGQDAIQEALFQVMAYMESIDILINGSGILSDRDPAVTMDVNLTGLIETTLAAIPLMSTAENSGTNGGLIVNVSCVFGLEPVAGAFAAIYTASKHAVIGFTKSLAHEVYREHTGIVHTAICPGPTATDMFTNFASRDTFDDSKPLSDMMLTAKTQTADDCGSAMVKAIKNTENGAVWLVNLGSAKLAEIPNYWSTAATL